MAEEDRGGVGCRVWPCSSPGPSPRQAVPQAQEEEGAGDSGTARGRGRQLLATPDRPPFRWGHGLHHRRRRRGGRMTPEERAEWKRKAELHKDYPMAAVVLDLIADLEAAEARVEELEDDLERTKAAE